MNRPLLIFLLLTACQDYRLRPQREEPKDSGGPLYEQLPMEPAGTIPPIDLVSRDTARPPCDLEPVAAAPYTGSPSCTPLPPVTWELVLEREILAATDADLHNFSGAPSVVPGLDDATAIFASHTNSTTSGADLSVYGGSTGTLVLAIPLDQALFGTPALSRGSQPGGPLGASAISGSGEPTLIDVDAGSEVVAAGSDRAALSSTRDLNHDGSPEYLFDSHAFGFSGDLVASWPGRRLAASAASDTDGDGHDEVFNGAGWWDATTGVGTAWGDWMSPEWSFFFGAAVRFAGEVLVAGHNGACLFVADGSGAIRWAYPPEDSDRLAEVPAPPALGDLDGDGVPELVADQHGRTVRAQHLDGTLLWQSTTGNGDYYISNCLSLADLDADGRHEVFVWGDTGLTILDGPTGATLARWEDAINWSWMAPPVIADVDGDGSSEIVLKGRREGDGSWLAPRIFILGPATGRWARTRPVWNQTAYDVTSIRDDGTVPAFPFPNYDTYNSWRAQPAHDGDHPDLEIEAVETCRDDEHDVVAVQAVVHNRGSQDAPAGAVVRLLTWDAALGGPLMEIASETLGEPIPSMTTSAGVIFRVTTEEWATRQVVQVDGTHDDECDRVNDRVDVWEE